MKKNKIWEYSPFVSFKDDKDVKHTLATQLYQTGIYMIFDNNPALQGGVSDPSPIVRFHKKLKKDAENKKITDLEFSIPIKVSTDQSGFLVKL